MTLTTMVTQVQNRLNLTSSTSLARIKDAIKERYGWVLGRLGTLLLTRETVTATATIGQRTVNLPNVQRVFDVFLTSGLVRLDAMSFEQLKNSEVVNDPPTAYAIALTDDTSVTIILNSTPATGFGLTADVAQYVDATALGDNTSPIFPAVFHDLLVHGAMATELRRMEKLDLAKELEALMMARVSALEAYLKEL